MTPACVNCQSSRLLSYLPYKYQTLEFFDLFPNLAILGCADCALVQVNHALLDAGKLKAFYENDYRRDDKPNSAYAAELKAARYAARGDALLKGMLPLIAAHPVRVIFELGAGYGYNIKRFGAHFSEAKLYADDPDSNHNLFETISRAKIGDVEPDIVIMSHVLEHLVFPRAYLQTIVNRLRPGGALVVEVPNEKHALLSNKPSHQPHISFFTRATLGKMFEGYGGLRVERVVSAGFLNEDNNLPRIGTEVRIDGWKPVKIVLDRRDLDRAGYDFTNERDDEEGSYLRLYAKKTV